MKTFILLAIIFAYLSLSCDAVLTNHHATTPADNHYTRAGTIDTFDKDMMQHDTQRFANSSSIPAISVVERAKRFVTRPLVWGTSVIMAALGEEHIWSQILLITMKSHGQNMTGLNNSQLNS